jgi:hypothetical protein
MSPAVMRLNAHLLGNIPPPPSAAPTGGAPRASYPKPDAAPALVRQSSKGMNKTEARFLDHLNQQAFRYIEFEGLTFRLANGSVFTPDFICWDEATMRPFCYDVKGTWKGNKGHAEDDAKVKIKVAASKYPWVNFYLAWWDTKDLRWNLQHVLP